MPGILPILGAGLGILYAVEVTPTVVARAEVAVGQAPETPGADPEATVISELRTTAGLKLASPRSIWTMGLTPRFHHRWPNQTERPTPLFLLQADLGNQYLLSRQVTWNTRLQGSVGEVDYTQTELVLTDQVPDRVRDSVVSAVTGEAQSGFTWQTTRTHSLSAGAVIGHTRSLGEIVTDATIRKTTTVGIDLAQEWQISNRAFILLPIAGRAYLVTGDPDSRSVEVSLGYRRLLDLRTTFEASAGIAAADAGDEPLRFLPVGNLSLERQVYATRTATVSNRIAARMEAAYDPTRVRVYTVGGLQASLNGQVGENLVPALSVEGYTAVTKDPVVLDTTTPSGSTDTRVAATATLGYKATSAVTIDVGGRFFSRAPHLSQRFELLDRTLLAFAGVTVALDFPSATAGRTPAGAGEGRSR